MKNNRSQILWAISILVLAAGCTSTPAADAHNVAQTADEPAHVSVGFLVLAPDRGFLGNEEIRDAFAELSSEQNAALVFVVDERSRSHLQKAVTELRTRGASRVVALPLFVTASHPQLALARELLDEIAPAGLEIAQQFGASYLAVETLADHYRRIADPAGRRIVVVGFGATDEPTRERMTDELRQIAHTAAAGFGFEDVRVVVWNEYSDDTSEDMEKQSATALQDAVEGGEQAMIVPFHLGKKLDTMMSFTGFLRYDLPDGAELLDADITPHNGVALWMRREANRNSLSDQDIGVVILAHGANFFWNETMREALNPVTERYRTEFAFSMADQPIVERAVRRLEARGARGIVIVRVFGMASSFRNTVERMVGVDVEGGAAHIKKPAAHGHGPAAAPPARIRSAAVITTVGGLEDHPLFARALTARAQELSQDAARETVILVAHGLGDDAKNDHWLSVLESLAGQMRTNGGEDFRAIKVATWREDWPDKREPWLARVREYVQDAADNNGLALVIPARTNARGGERELLDGLDFKLGEGFAPHPLFARWVEDQIRDGQVLLLTHPAIATVASKSSE